MAVTALRHPPEPPAPLTVPPHHDARDEAWFTALYDETLESVHRYASVIVRDAHLADDVVAETFLRAWRSRASYRGEGRPLAWLLTIARNCALSALSARREEIDLTLVDEPEDPRSAPVTFESDEAERIRVALSHLTSEQQQVIFLRFFKEMPHDEVARAMGRNPGAVRALQFRALSRIRELLEAGDAR